MPIRIFRGTPWRIYALSLAGGMLSLSLCLRMLEGIPHISDEISYMFQGRILASGHLWLPSPPVREAFAFGHILITPDRWCSIYSAGWPLILALGWLLHVPWIINPLFLSLTILGVWRLANFVFDARTAYLSTVLFAASPFVLLMSSGWMSHPAAMFFVVWSAAFAMIAAQTQKSSHMITASLLAGAAFLIRPPTAVAMIWPLFLWLFVRSKMPKWKVLLLLSCGILPFVAIYLIYNAMLFHHPVLGGYVLDPYWDMTNAVKLNFAERLCWYVTQWNQAAWGWPWPDLLILLPVLIFWRSWMPNWWLIASPVSLLIAHSFYYYTDIVYSGPRFIYEAMPFVAILAGQSVDILLRSLGRFGRIPAGIFQVFFLGFLLIFPFAVRLPDQVKYHSQIYHGQTRKFITFVETQKIGKSALVLLSGDDYSLGTFYFVNALRPEQGARVFVRDVPSSRAQILREFPRKEVWQLVIKLKPLPGPNHYHDRWDLEMIRLQRCCDPM